MVESLGAGSVTWEAKHVFYAQEVFSRSTKTHGNMFAIRSVSHMLIIYIGFMSSVDANDELVSE